MVSRSVMRRLVEKYVELCEACYRVSVATHDRQGRFRPNHRGRHPHPTMLKKIDLDEALAQVYRRFFASSQELNESSNSKSRRHGSETRKSSSGGGSRPASRSE